MNENSQSQNDGIYAIYANGNMVTPIFSQARGQWAETDLYKVLDKNGNPQTFHNAGCGVTSLTNICNLLGIDCVPMDFNNVLSTSDEPLKATFEEMGCKVTTLNSKEDIRKSLEDGNPVMLRVSRGGNSYGTRSTQLSAGHYISLLGLNEDGTVVLADPGWYSNQGSFDLEKDFADFDKFAMAISISKN